MKTRFFAGALAALMLAGSLVACGNGQEATTKPQGSTGTATEHGTEAQTTVYDTLEKADYNGDEFLILGEKMRDYYTTDQYTGDIISDAVYDRNLKVEDLYNIDLTYNIVAWQAGADEIKKTCAANENTYSLMTNTHLYLGPCISEGCFVNWNEVTSVHTDRPWYVNSANKAYAIGDTTMLLFGDFLESDILTSWVMIYNKKLANDNGIGDLYSTVADGNWTLEYVANLVKNIYHDENGNGKKDKADSYGYVIDNNACIDSFCRSMGLSGISKDADNQPVLNFYSEKAENAYSQIYNLIYNNQGVYMEETSFGHTDDFFVTDKAVFSQTLMFMLITGGMTDFKGYGILPIPKYSQDSDYLTYQDGTFSAMMIPATLPESDWERTGVITEALNAVSYDRVTPMIYERALKAKAADAPEDAQMITVILNGRAYSYDSMDEIGYPYSPFNMLRTNIQQKKSVLSSYYQANIKKANLWIAYKIAEFEKEN